MAREIFNPIDALLLEAIELDAAAGRPARYNADYAEAIGASLGALKEAMRRLRQRGLIYLERQNTHVRRFTVTATGDCTAWSAAGNPSAEARGKTTRRPCMCCGDYFPSEHIGHRLCEPCKRRDGPPDPDRNRGFYAGASQ